MSMMKSSRRGLNLRQWKEQSIARPSLLHAPAGDLWLPLRRRGEEPFALTAEVGSRVERDQPVAVCRESSRAPIFAPAAGRSSPPKPSPTLSLRKRFSVPCCARKTPFQPIKRSR